MNDALILFPTSKTWSFYYTLYASVLSDSTTAVGKRFILQCPMNCWLKYSSLFASFHRMYCLFSLGQISICSCSFVRCEVNDLTVRVSLTGLSSNRWFYWANQLMLKTNMAWNRNKKTKINVRYSNNMSAVLTCWKQKLRFQVNNAKAPTYLW